MVFEDVSGNGNLWAVIYDGEEENVIVQTFTNWFNPDYLYKFFMENSVDLAKNFRITNLNQAVFDTIEDANKFACVIFDFSPDMELDMVFRPLENYRTAEMTLSREKAKGYRICNHPSWLRLYAIKLDEGSYLVTGGTIKLTWKMDEREHTLQELKRMEQVRNFLLGNGVTDLDALKDYKNNESN